MKRVKVILTFLIMIGFACSDKGPEINSIYGKWEWVKSTGGLLSERTPQTSGYTEMLKIDENVFEVYRDGVLISSTQYKITRNTNKQIDADFILIDLSDPNNNRQVKFESTDNKQISITFYAGINSTCADCETDFYAKLNENFY